MFQPNGAEGIRTDELGSGSEVRRSWEGNSTWGDRYQRVDLHDEVMLQAQEAHDGEEVDEDEGEQRRQQDGAPVTRHALDHVEQRLLPVDEVEQLRVRRVGR